MSWSTPYAPKPGNSLIGLLYRRFSSNVNSHALLDMYNLLVRPQLEYSAPVWNISKLEKVQKIAIRMWMLATRSY